MSLFEIICKILQKGLDKNLKMMYYIIDGKYNQKNNQRAHLLLCREMPESERQTKIDLAKISWYGGRYYRIQNKTQGSEAQANKTFRLRWSNGYV